MISTTSCVLLICLVPISVYATAYYEITSPTGETSYQPFFSLSQAGNYVGPVLIGAGIAFVVTLGVLLCCGSSRGLLKTSNFEDEIEKEEEEAIVAPPAKKNSTAKRARRDVSYFSYYLLLLR